MAIFLTVFSFFVLLGAGHTCDSSDYECFLNEPGFSPEAKNEYERGDDLFPSNAFFQASCSQALAFLNCYGNLSKNCGLELLMIDITAVISHVSEFCDENSDIRKAYVRNIACYNSINVTSEACMVSVSETMRKVKHNKEISQTMISLKMETECILFHLLSSCAVDMVEILCGEEAGENVQDILNALNDSFMCDRQQESFYAELLDKLN
uniref:Secretory protein n=1 Tax=Chilobrachys guangxiensis TaxID=278060 RepID=B1P1K2_CHIGU|nr:secretory protein [Chilobrachys guangxiensis]